MTNRKIVIADDEPDILNLLAAIFRAKKYEVLSASDGAIALNLIETHRPAAAVLDFMMPQLDGITVCQKARQIIPELFVVIISGVGSEKLKSLSEEAQADDYLEKPLMMTTLIQKVEAGLKQREQTANTTG